MKGNNYECTDKIQSIINFISFAAKYCGEATENSSPSRLTGKEKNN